MGRLLVGDVRVELSDPPTEGCEPLRELVDRLLLLEHHLRELSHLALEVRVANLQVHEPCFHARGSLAQTLAITHVFGHEHPPCPPLKPGPKAPFKGQAWPRTMMRA